MSPHTLSTHKDRISRDIAIWYGLAKWPGETPSDQYDEWWRAVRKKTRNYLPWRAVVGAMVGGAATECDSGRFCSAR